MKPSNFKVGQKWIATEGPDTESYFLVKGVSDDIVTIQWFELTSDQLSSYDQYIGKDKEWVSDYRLDESSLINQILELY